MRNFLRAARRYLGLAIPVVVFILIFGGFIWFAVRDIEPETLAKNRDLAIIFISLSIGISVVLFSIFIGVVVWLLVLMKDKIVPLMDTVLATTDKIKETTDVVAENVMGTSKRVKDTTDFVTQEVASPLIKVSGLVAQGRAWMKVVTRGK